ncbi:IclR family transcriptional regulator [Nocardioides zeae]|uniref:DNA-binding IclR family transcriptional regulator n=1 Tax=Nocardioides zeae TaxID=1457234 RepID=A0AAJ1U4C4_9ACTN|nr:IclR family transcriptional regulator [Nocardioides zeae]MDQ1105630.1 DNA-binding IclR family transcriptional regulator [Nocardioides zeae]
MARSPSGEGVVERVVRMLESFDPATPAMTVGELAARAGLPPSTASRLVDQLVSHQLLRRDARGQVRVGVRMWELAARASPAQVLREVSMPFMEDLQAVVGHHTQLGVLDGRDVLFLERLSARGAVINVTRIAGRLPLHASSAGLVLLAHASRGVQEQVLAGPLQSYTHSTVTDPARLRALLADVRHQGFAECRGHIDLAATGVAVPVREPSGSVIAGLALVIPNDGSSTRPRIDVLRTAARGLERALRGPRGAAEQRVSCGDAQSEPSARSMGKP